ncbi:MAG: tripartite tricarboxylate transporter TctB family protein [Desulfobulbaceae bacterium]|nr:tripartite tricarboxylate transporter TctB family protein [Desulfobulbaceae bacterium]
MNPSMNKDLFAGIFGLAFGGILLYESIQLSYPSKTFPLLISTVTVVFSLSILIFTILSRNSKVFSGNTDGIIPSRLTIYIIISSIIYISMIDILGFYSSSFFCIIFLSSMLSNKKLEIKTFIFSCLSSFIFLFFVYIIFSLFIKVSIPDGILI